MLTDSMTVKLIDFYEESSTKKIKRKEVKIIVDSLIEQLCQFFFQSCPDGISNIRKKINSSIARDNDNKEVLEKFDQMLRAYHEAFSKSYSDHTDSYNSFLNGELKTLILALIKLYYIKDISLSMKLRELLL